MRKKQTKSLTVWPGLTYYEPRPFVVPMGSMKGKATEYGHKAGDRKKARGDSAIRFVFPRPRKKQSST
jgi:hypothetical protein